LNPLSLKQGFDVLREVDLGAIQRAAEEGFTMLLVGEPDLTQRLASELEVVPGGGFVVQAKPPLAVGTDIAQPAAALLVTGDGLVSADLAKARDQLEDAGVPVLEVRLGAPAGPALDFESAVAPRLIALGASDPSFGLTFARHFPAARDAYVRDLVEDVSRVNATYAFSTGLGQLVPAIGIPLALADILVLTKNQLIMAYKIALAAGKPATGRLLLAQVLAVIGSGLLFRQIARELVGLAPGIGIVPKTAIAYAGTRIVGQAVRTWALEGRELEASELRTLYGEALDAGTRVADEIRMGGERLRGRLSPDR